jgi:hypothetical protein
MAASGANRLDSQLAQNSIPVVALWVDFLSARETMRCFPTRHLVCCVVHMSTIAVSGSSGKRFLRRRGTARTPVRPAVQLAVIL